MTRDEINRLKELVSGGIKLERIFDFKDTSFKYGINEKTATESITTSLLKLIDDYEIMRESLLDIYNPIEQPIFSGEMQFIAKKALKRIAEI